MKDFIMVVLLGVGTFITLFGQKENSGSNPAVKEYEINYNRRIKQESLNGIYIPKDVQEALDIIIESSDSSGLFRLKRVSEEMAANGLRKRLGKWILVRWGFEEGSRLSHYIKTKYRVSHPEDMSEFIVRALYRKVNQKPLDLDQIATFMIKRRADARAERMKKAKTEVLYKRKVSPDQHQNK